MKFWNWWKINTECPLVTVDSARIPQNPLCWKTLRPSIAERKRPRPHLGRRQTVSNTSKVTNNRTSCKFTRVKMHRRRFLGAPEHFGPCIETAYLQHRLIVIYIVVSLIRYQTGINQPGENANAVGVFRHYHWQRSAGRLVTSYSSCWEFVPLRANMQRYQRRSVHHDTTISGWSYLHFLFEKA